MSALDVAELACHPSAGADVAGLTVVATGRLPVVALVGRPNVGKSTFFARATGRYAETSNLPGTTVGTTALRVEHDGEAAILVDLPGAHSLTDRSDGLPAFWEQLSAARPDAILSVVDAGDLARHLPLTLACRDLGLPIVVAANLADEAAAHGIELDAGRLSQLLVAPVHRTVGRKGIGVDAAVGDAIRLASRRAAGGLDADIRARPAIPYPAEDVRAVAALVRQLSEGAAPPGGRAGAGGLGHERPAESNAAASVAASDSPGVPAMGDRRALGRAGRAPPRCAGAPGRSRGEAGHCAVAGPPAVRPGDPCQPRPHHGGRHAALESSSRACGARPSPLS